MKSEVEQSKHATAPGKPSKCSYGEFVSIAEEFVNRYQRNVHRGVVGDGPYKLSQNYQHAAVTEDNWKNMTKKEKAAKISIFDPVGYKKLLTFAATGTSTSTKSGSSQTTPPKAPVLSSVSSQVAFFSICEDRGKRQGTLSARTESQKSTMAQMS